MNPSNQPEPKKPLCADAWAVPASARMIAHGKPFYTCSKCGEPCDVVDLKQNSPVKERVSQPGKHFEAPDSSIPYTQDEGISYVIRKIKPGEKVITIRPSQAGRGVPKTVIIEDVTERLARLQPPTAGEGESL